MKSAWLLYVLHVPESKFKVNVHTQKCICVLLIFIRFRANSCHDTYFSKTKQKQKCIRIKNTKVKFIVLPTDILIFAKCLMIYPFTSLSKSIGMNRHEQQEWFL